MRSHLLPAALYKYLGIREGVRPVRIGDGFVVPTDRQVQTHLLCSSCEDLLNKQGESWVVPKLATYAGSFPLYDLMTSQPAVAEDSDVAIYFTSENPLVKAEELTHFAMGIFWKASVHSWQRDKLLEPMIKLDPISDKIRRWLLGETALTDNVCLIVRIYRPERAQIALTLPAESSRKGWRTFFMYLLGVSFNLDVGSRIDPQLRRLFLSE